MGLVLRINKRTLFKDNHPNDPVSDTSKLFDIYTNTIYIYVYVNYVST